MSDCNGPSAGPGNAAPFTAEQEARIATIVAGEMLHHNMVTGGSFEDRNLLTARIEMHRAARAYFGIVERLKASACQGTQSDGAARFEQRTAPQPHSHRQGDWHD